MSKSKRSVPRSTPTPSKQASDPSSSKSPSFNPGSKPNPSQSAPKRSESTIEEDLTLYTSGMRIFGGMAWGTLLTLLLGSILVIIPQVPRSWLWSIPPGWLVLVGVGVALQWSVARGQCPKCGTSLVVPTSGRRCPTCKTALKALNREIVRIY